ncbi:hypothetical protein SH661x_002314 [Planctomicrobium sp. SH661]|uniref:hypothetical protein n=1 Tax=Planctomicrobium sp. SH661 TaxID=3448124 RepID=UPI003F5C0EA9
MAAVRFNSNMALGGRMELDKRLMKLADKDARRISRNSVRAGLRVGAKDLRQAVPVGESKKIKKAVGISLKKDRNNKAGLDVGKWGVNVGKKRDQMAKHGFAVMAGTTERTQKTTGRSTGQIKITRRITFETALKSRAAVVAKIAETTEKGLAKLKK